MLSLQADRLEAQDQQVVLQQALLRLRARAAPLEELQVVQLAAVRLEELQVVLLEGLRAVLPQERRAVQQQVALLLERQREPQVLSLQRQVRLELLLRVLV